MKKADIEQWLDDYVQAWQSYDREAIAALFSSEVEYRYHPNDEPLRGREAVIRSWLGEGADDNDPDAPGTVEANYRPVAVDGDVAVATGTSSYRDEPGGEIVRVYDNCFVMRFDDDGRCAEFTEWYVKRPAP
jgi:ketosteroid isomerase-like protein